MKIQVEVIQVDATFDFAYAELWLQEKLYNKSKTGERNCDFPTHGILWNAGRDEDKDNVAVLVKVCVPNSAMSMTSLHQCRDSHQFIHDDRIIEFFY